MMSNVRANPERWVQNPPAVRGISWPLRFTGLLARGLLVLASAGVCHAGSRYQPLLIVQNGKYGYINEEGRIGIQPSVCVGQGFLARPRHGLRLRALCIDRSGECFRLLDRRRKFGYVNT